MRIIKGKIQNIDYIAIGLILHSIGGIFFTSSKILCYTLCGLGIILPLYGFLISSKKTKEFTPLYRSILLIYNCWNMITIIRPILIGDLDKESFSPINPYMLFAFFLPFTTMITYNSNTILSKIIKYNMICAVIGVFLTILFSKIILFSNMLNLDYEEYQDYINLINIPTSFLFIASTSILFTNFLSFKYKVFAWSSLGIGLLIMMLGARRSGMINYLILILFYLVLYFKRKDVKFKKMKLLLVLSLLTLSTYYIFTNIETIFPFLSSRLEEDSRSGVEEYFHKSFDNTTDWFWGRGLTGTYYCPLFTVPNRNIIETGYLNIILKGGLISLVLYLYLLTVAFIKGFFYSQNLFVKGLSLYILFHIILLIPFGLPYYGYEFFLLWLAVIICNSKQFRFRKNHEIQSLIQYI